MKLFPRGSQTFEDFGALVIRPVGQLRTQPPADDRCAGRLNERVDAEADEPY